MATLEKRLAVLEAATDDQTGGYLDIPPVMTEAEWDAIAPMQQAALVKETYEQNS